MESRILLLETVKGSIDHRVSEFREDAFRVVSIKAETSTVIDSFPKPSDMESSKKNSNASSESGQTDFQPFLKIH